MFAHLMIAGVALETMAASADKRYGDPVADLPLGDMAAESLNRSGKFMAGHVRQLDIGVVTHPAMPVAAAQSRCFDLDDNARRGRDRIGHRTD
eukprot:gene28868-biopygen24276